MTIILSSFNCEQDENHTFEQNAFIKCMYILKKEKLKKLIGRDTWRFGQFLFENIINYYKDFFYKIISILNLNP